ncbi:hypothetical protein BGP77_11710 [Saccharospirillum sp. MSK14-1]|nr:hypothetical protein BGP77_11710 [Saccharospirillum sp. MSK14-1]
MGENKCQGLGDPDFTFAVHIGNRPPMPEFDHLDGLREVSPGDIARIVKATGNHWRKIFNIYAKLIFELNSGQQGSWQDFRDQQLLQKGSALALLFSKPNLLPDDKNIIQIITGKTYAEELGLLSKTVEVQAGFFVVEDSKIIITPYFDYRQLSNQKITRLVSLIQSLPN